VSRHAERSLPARSVQRRFVRQWIEASPMGATLPPITLVPGSAEGRAGPQTQADWGCGDD
jgi:hypothetical protein